MLLGFGGSLFLFGLYMCPALLQTNKSVCLIDFYIRHYMANLRKYLWRLLDLILRLWQRPFRHLENDQLERCLIMEYLMFADFLLCSLENTNILLRQLLDDYCIQACCIIKIYLVLLDAQTVH